MKKKVDLYILEDKIVSMTINNALVPVSDLFPDDFRLGQSHTEHKRLTDMFTFTLKATTLELNLYYTSHIRLIIKTENNEG